MEQNFTCNKCHVSLPSNEFYFAKKRGKIIRYNECKPCFRARINQRHNENKLILVNEHGGCCQRCGYNSSPRVLHFHHLDPNNKEFGLGTRPSASLSELRKEAAKCILLCPNCHAEKHEGMW